MKKDEFEKELEDLKSQIKAIQEGIRKLRKTGMNINLIYLMIQKASPHVGGRYKYTPVSVKVIKAVLDGIEGLYDYVFPPKEDT